MVLGDGGSSLHVVSPSPGNSTDVTELTWI